MFKAVNRYYELNFDKLIEMKEMIAKENIEITCVNNSGISIIIPGNSIETLILENKNNNSLLKDAKYYISSFSNKFFNLSDPGTNKDKIVYGNDQSQYSEFEYFYHIYKNCVAKDDKLKKINEQLLNKIIKENTAGRIHVLKPYLDCLKLEQKSTKLSQEIASNIERLLTGLGMIARLDFIHYLKYIKGDEGKTHKDISALADGMVSNIMSNIVSHLDKEYAFKDVFERLDVFNDANILSHSNRVFIMMVEFLLYYNNSFTKGLSNRLRQDCKSIYFDQYKRVLSNFKISVAIDKLESVFKLGIRKLTTSEIINYATGVFYHDLTMLNTNDFLPISDFLESGDFKDFHSFKSYYFLKYVLAQKDEISLISGLHHEFYGYGTGMFAKFLEKKANDPKHKIDFLVSFEADDITNADVIAYFPAKMLEVVDVYDTLTFINGVKSSSPQNVLIYMRKKFLDEEVKIDPIIFYLFTQFLYEMKGIDMPIDL